ncbi:MAG TPA: hypothetical protein VEY71_00630, partial [Chitinophagales bacterium]|nr:hypothetical protein [Chitinophagales bacterium]
LLDQFVHKSGTAAATPEEAAKPGFLDSLGFGDKFKEAGINMNGLTKGLIGIAGPMLLARLLSGGLSRGRRGGALGGGMGGSLGGLLGGLGGMGGGMGRAGGMGGLGSLIGMLSGGRGYRGIGGMRNRILP